MKTTRNLIACLLLLLGLSACEKWWESDSPTAPDDRVPFGSPVATWDSGIGTMPVYRADGPTFSEAAYQDSLDDLLVRIGQVAGVLEVAKLSLSGQILVLQDSRKGPRYDDREGAFWVSSPGEFQVLALDFFCRQSGNGSICGLR